jgi:hypothetical protein
VTCFSFLSFIVQVFVLWLVFLLFFICWFGFLIENGLELTSLAVHESSVMNGPGLGMSADELQSSRSTTTSQAWPILPSKT